jgi:hypothetical protein
VTGECFGRKLIGCGILVNPTVRRSDRREREREREEGEKENKTIKKILFKENEVWNRDYCWSDFWKTSG